MIKFLTDCPLAEAVGITAAFGITARLLGTVSNSGLAGGVVVGSAIYYFSGWPGFAVLGAFFVLASVLTRLGRRRKSELGAAQGDSGRRGARHAAANCAAGVILAAACKFSGGDTVIAAGFVASFATAAADTAGSEVGPVFGGKSVLAWSFRRVPPGTPGAVSLTGTLAGVVAAAVVALVGMAAGMLGTAGLAATVVLAAVAAAWIESVLGSLPGVEARLGNEGLNVLNTVMGASLCMAMAAMR